MTNDFLEKNSFMLHSILNIAARCTAGKKTVFILMMVSFCMVVIHLSACKKDHAGNIGNSNIDTAGLIHRLAGNYSVNYICSHSNPYPNSVPTYYDTTVGASWSVRGDTTPGNIIVNGATLHFSGDLSAKRYYFEYTAGTAGQNILFDSMFAGFTTQWGYPYTNCYGSGTRIP